MPQYQLVVRRGPRAGETLELKSQTVIVGRDSTADIIINDPEVSRDHCRLILDRSYYLQDLGSTNGTFIDGQRLGGEPAQLANGQVLQLGSNVTLLYQIIETVDVIESTPEENDVNEVDASSSSPEAPVVASTAYGAKERPSAVREIKTSARSIGESQPLSGERSSFNYSDPKPSKETLFDGSNSPDLNNGMPWENWTQRQWLIALSVLVFLLLCVCCLFLTMVVILVRPELLSSTTAAMILLR
jgi:pSer/pThr/pTyr-binding forkhead associated (FHA) protein